MEINEILAQELQRRIHIELPTIHVEEFIRGSYHIHLLIFNPKMPEMSPIGCMIWDDQINVSMNIIKFDVCNPEFGDGSKLINEVIDIIRKWTQGIYVCRIKQNLGTT